MSKLDGNNRWSGKMLLTEHQEQYEFRGEKPKGKATVEEITLVRDSILLQHVITMVQKGLDEIVNSRITLHQTMSLFMRVMLDRASLFAFNVRRELKSKSIRVLSDETSDDIIYHRFLCRGYEEKLGMTREVMRAEIAKQISRMVSEILRTEKPNKE